jgi:hypothetical protein
MFRNRGAIIRELSEQRYTTPPDTIHVIHCSRTRSIKIIIDRDRCLYAYFIQSVTNWKLLPETPQLKKIKFKYCNFMITIDLK